MALIPRALRPTTYLRRKALKRGVQSQNQVLQLLALLLVGRPALIRQTAFRQGFAGSSRLWRTVAIGYVTAEVWRKLTVKEAENLGTERLGVGQHVAVYAMERPTRRELRRAARAS